MKKLTSLQNPLIKDLIKLQEKSRERRKKNMFLIEGKREISLALKGNFEILKLFFVADLFSQQTFINTKNSKVDLVEITKEIYEKIAYRDSTEGVVALVKAKDFSLKNINFKNKNPLVLVLEAIEKPGNIGAILRTADAANVDAVLMANPKTDLFNPNIIRSSIGCLFTNQIATGSSEEIIQFLKKNNINIYSTTLQNSNKYYTEDYTNASAIIVGTEATGLTKIWRENASKNINIPMQGHIDSINVSVATAIVLFEAKRQRGF